MAGVKATPRVGNDGYYYYTYGINAEWEVETETGLVRYQTVEALWDEEREGESYLVRVQSEKQTQHREMTIGRLQYLLKNALRVTELEAGTSEELPLTRAEVTQYYKRIVGDRNKRRREANAKLKDNKEYQKLLSEEKKIYPLWVDAIAYDLPKEEALAKRMGKLTAEKQEILRELGIDQSDLSVSESCVDCGGKGITSRNAICVCARAKSDQIKAYCAAERLAERRKGEL